MKICTSCGYQNRIGMLFCEECGASLENVPSTIATRQVVDDDMDSFIPKATWGSAKFTMDSVIVIHVRDNVEPIELQPMSRIVLGRQDESDTNTPDVDLTPYGGLEKGVSRKHAVIEQNEDTLTLVDVGSSNGTYLNGQRLIPDQPRVLRDGDEFRLGRLVAHIYFK